MEIVMENEEIEQKLSKIEKKLDKLLTITTKMAKALHLLPVTEKEERDIQVQQRENLRIAAKINSELNDMQNKSDNPSSEGLLSANTADIEDSAAFEGIFGDDLL